MVRRVLDRRVCSLFLVAAPRAGAAAARASQTGSCRSTRCRRRAAAGRAAPVGAYVFFLLLMMFYLWTIWRRLGKVEHEMRDLERRPRGHGAVTAGHFIFIPAVLLVGLVIGWILGSRAARDAYRDGAEAARRAGGQQGGASSRASTAGRAGLPASRSAAPV